MLADKRIIVEITENKIIVQMEKLLESSKSGTIGNLEIRLDEDRWSMLDMRIQAAGYDLGEEVEKISKLAKALKDVMIFSCKLWPQEVTLEDRIAQAGKEEKHSFEGGEQDYDTE